MVAASLGQRMAGSQKLGRWRRRWFDGMQIHSESSDSASRGSEGVEAVLAAWGGHGTAAN